MKASINWLEDFIDLSELTPRQVADKLTMAGLEVENLFDRFAHLKTVVAARLAEVSPLPGSGHLKICRVEAGDRGSFEVVCGAPNAREGLVAPLALPGTVLPGGQEVMTAEIWGRSSEGMLCSETELGLGRDASGLMELGGVAGRTLKEITGREDWILEIGITPNRSDGLSIIGLARDLSALLDRPLRQPEIIVEETGPDVNSLARVTIADPEHCFRFAARVITDVKIGPSPAWLADRLAGVGLRSINNVVDVTNYVMIEMGQPLHAYDLETVADHHLIARAYPRGTAFTTLDGQERELPSDVNLMICDGEKPVGLAGIMGGLNSEIENSTRHIMLEGAAFNATTIRRTSRALGLSTDASYRFERGSDPEICGRAVDRAISMMAEVAGGQVAVGRIDRYPFPFKPVVAPFSPARCNAHLGTSHSAADMIRVLTAIGLKIEGQGDEATAAALPSWRPDLTREVDIWEEVARLLNFEGLPATLPQPPMRRQAPPPAWTLRAMVREHLCARGMSESITYSFINRNFSEKLALPEDSVWRKRILPILNPLSEEQGILRPLLAPSLLAALRLNQSYGRTETALFELGASFLSNGPDRQPDERQTIAGVWSGRAGGGTWIDPARPVDFWDIKGLMEGLAEHLNLEMTYSWNQDLPPWYDLNEAAAIDWPLGRLGHMGRLNKKAAKAFGLKEAAGPVYLFELDAQILLDAGLCRAPFTGWSKFPPNERDMALVVDQSIPAAEIVAAIKADPAMPLTDVLVFDLYQGDQLPSGKKSLAFRLTFQSREYTLTDEKVNLYFTQITQKLTDSFGAVLRS